MLLLQAFMSHDAPRALKYLQQYAHLLNDLHLNYSNLRPLRSLMSSISLPKEEGYSDGGEVLVAIARPQSPEPLPANWNNLKNNLTTLTDDELCNVLEELDHLSNRRPGILESVAEKIAPMILMTHMSVRQLGHSLLIRYIKFCPASVDMSSPILGSVVKSLDSNNSDVVNSTLDKLPEYVVCLQGKLTDRMFLL